MATQLKTRFLANLELALPEEDRGIATFEKNDPRRFFAWVSGKAVDVKIGKLEVILDKESLDAFIERHANDPAMPKDRTLSSSRKFQEYLNNNKDAAQMARAELKASQDAFQVDVSNIFIGSSRVFDDTIQTMKKLSKDVASRTKDLAMQVKEKTHEMKEEIKQTRVGQKIAKFIEDAGKSKPAVFLEKQLDEIKEAAKGITGKLKTSIEEWEASVRKMLKSKKEQTPQDKDTSVFRKDVQMPPEKQDEERKK